ncbi:hypothetical protein [Clostridium thermobutyricum]|uniref:hypothetical protein n=1 Tax=Clostridium thermobutyricum TaxID=29372 RepID=UPI0018AC6E3B|nr:hypothetical protein [Clostridium thermobutyricum]
MKENLQIPLTEIFTDTFIQNNTKFKSFPELLSKGNFTFKTQDEFTKLYNTPEFNKFISQNTKFKDYFEMYNEGVTEYLKTKFVPEKVSEAFENINLR